MKEKFAAAHQKNVEFGKELHQKQLNLDAAKEAVELSIRQNQELTRTEQNQREEELQKNLDLQASLQKEREARKKDVAALN